LQGVKKKATDTGWRGDFICAGSLKRLAAYNAFRIILAAVTAQRGFHPLRDKRLPAFKALRILHGALVAYLSGYADPHDVCSAFRAVAAFSRAREAYHYIRHLFALHDQVHTNL
jgi:hypothetical protein